MSYMEKKTTKRQTTIISLSDANQREIEDILKDKEKMLQDFEEQKAGENSLILSSPQFFTSG